MLPAFISQSGSHTCKWIELVMVRSIMLRIESHFLYGQDLNIIIIISSFVLDLRSHKQQQGSKVGNLQKFSQSTHASSGITNRVE